MRDLTASEVAIRLPGGVHALEGVSCAIRPGQLSGLIGPNGAGKSTLARVLAGLLEPDRGTVALGGAPLRGLPRRALAREVAYLPQEAPADLPFTAAEVALMGRSPHLGALALESAADLRLAAAALERLGVREAAQRPLAELSGGERRRVLLARVLVQEAPLWILDEPTAHLDLAHQHLVLRLAREHVRAGGGALLVLHDVTQAARACDRVLLLDRGRAAAEGPPGEALRPELLASVFGVRFTSVKDPDGGDSVLLPALEPRGPAV